jgi:hypothetical protein
VGMSLTQTFAEGLNLYRSFKTEPGKKIDRQEEYMAKQTAFYFNLPGRPLKFQPGPWDLLCVSQE